ncbi:MAG: hypothetical protein HUK22_03195 [Thermoguttaceae bacterium]|nr:hypothetical protein [Thermoguttaceae bacterium]
MVLIIDAFSSPRGASNRPEPTLRYSSKLPLADGIAAAQTSKWQEIVLTDVQPSDAEPLKTRILPLSADEWRNTSSNWTITLNKRGITTNAARAGTTLISATLVDANPRRAKRDCTWRPLTICEGGKIVGDDVAFGVFVQLGLEKYVVYASATARPAARSILGRQWNSDFVFGKFLASQGVVPILEVDLE